MAAILAARALPVRLAPARTQQAASLGAVRGSALHAGRKVAAASSAFVAAPAKALTASRRPASKAQAAPLTEATKSPNRQAKGGKCKTRKAAAKRYRITGSGLVIRRGAHCKHLLRKKSGNKRNVLAKDKVVSEADMNNIISMLPYAGLR